MGLARAREASNGATPIATPAAWQPGVNLALDASFSNLTNSVTFRLYGWGSSVASKLGGIDNFSIQGSWLVPGMPGTALSIR